MAHAKLVVWLTNDDLSEDAEIGILSALGEDIHKSGGFAYSVEED